MTLYQLFTLGIVERRMVASILKWWVHQVSFYRTLIFDIFKIAFVWNHFRCIPLKHHIEKMFQDVYFYRLLKFRMHDAI